MERITESFTTTVVTNSLGEWKGREWKGSRSPIHPKYRTRAHGRRSHLAASFVPRHGWMNR